MTYIEKIYLKGFKSFAKPIELEFSNGFSTVIGPNGSGKSAAYDTSVISSDGSETLLGELVENQLKKAREIKKLDDGVYCDNREDIKIISLNPVSMKTEAINISKFIRREGEPYLYEIKTNCGKKVKTTGCHPLIVFRNGRLVSSLVRDLKERDLLAAPRIIHTSSYKKDADFARLFGYIIGDGYVRTDRIEFVNKDKEIIDDFKKLILKIFNLEPKYEKSIKGTTRLIYRNRTLTNKIISLIKNNKDKYTSKYKYIPDHILDKDLNTVSNILAGLYDTDGSVRKDLGIIEFCTKNEKLVNQVQCLLLRFGITSRKKERLCQATNTAKKIRRKYHFLYIEGQNNIEKFYYNIPLQCKHKKIALENHLKNKKISNPNIDILPRETNLLIRRAVKLLGVKYKPPRKEYQKLAAYIENRCNPTRQGLNEILEILDNKLLKIYSSGLTLKKDQFNLIGVMDELAISGRSASKAIGMYPQHIRGVWATGKWNPKPQNLDAFFDFIKSAVESRTRELKHTLNTLHTLADSHIFWERIVSIKKVKGEKYVYDLTIPNNHNFIGNGIFIHNSNIMDAFTFVLGKTSAKQMRAEKAASLIFNGGKKGSQMREAEVYIQFSNKEKEFPIASQSVKISRIVRQSGNSIYLINGEKRTRQQVVDLLSKARVNPDGFNIVLQGDITLFAEMKPNERRIIIEDISGISVYEDKKRKALLELDKVDNKLNDAKLILKEREVHLRELKKERDQALKFKELESSIKESKATHLHLKIKDKEFKKDEIESRIKKQKTSQDSITKKVLENKEKIDQKKSELEKINKDIEEKGEVEQLELQKNIESLRAATIKDSTRLETVTNEISHIKQRISTLKNDEEEIQNKIKQLNEEQKELEEKSTQLKEKEINLQSELKEKSKLSDTASLEKLESEINALQDKLFDIRQGLSHENIIQTQKTHELKAIEENLEKLASPLVKKKQQEFEKTDSTLSKLVDKSNVTQTLIEKNHIKISKLREELSDLQGTKIRITRSLAGNQAINTILNSKIKGVFGTIASLGKADSKYSTALEVTAAGRINSIITDSDLTASKCIKILKEKRTGIAMFLPLNKLQTRNIKTELEQMKNFSGVKDLALNLIKYDKKFEKAFSYVFGSTLVVEDLSTARKVGIGRTRMVTIDGDLVEPSGAMIGGFRRKTTGIFEQKDIDKNISQKDLEISELKNNSQKLMKQRQSEQDEIQKLSKEKAILEAELTRLQHSSKLEDLTKLKKKKTELSNLIKNSQNKKKSLEAEEQNITRQLNRLKEQRKPQSKQSTIELLHESHKELRENLSQITTQIKNIQNQISSIHKPEIEKIQEIIAQHKKEIEDFTSESNSLKNTLQKSQNKLKEAEKVEKKFRDDYKALFNKRNKISEDIRKYESLISQEDFKQREIEKKINEISLLRAKAVAELEALQSEFEPYIGTKLRRNISIEDLKREISDFERLLKNIGNVNLKALEIYDTIREEFEELNKKKNALETEKNSVLGMMAEIEGKKKRVFLKTYKQIADNFKSIFLTLSSKGDAYLELEDKENPLEGGINIIVRLAGTKFLDLHSLSGGEKTLTALALIFAIQEYEPAPFYLLDEVDAALDKTNSQLLANLVAKHAKSSQVVMISHNDALITDANQIYGVSMQQNGISKITSLKL